MISKLRSKKEELEAQADQKNKEIEDLQSTIRAITASSDGLQAVLSAEKEANEQALKLVDIEKDGREEAQSTISNLQAELAEVKEKYSILYQENEASKGQISELEREKQELELHASFGDLSCGEVMFHGGTSGEDIRFLRGKFSESSRARP